MRKRVKWLCGFLLLMTMTSSACEGKIPASNSTATATTIKESFSEPAFPEVSQAERTDTPIPSPSSIPPTTTVEPSATPEQTATPSWVGPDTFPEGVNPLTGLEPEDSSRLDRRPVLIKISNYPAILRPHSGLSYADMVWEYFIGTGMTRFLALYYGKDAPRVGPIRSGRLIDPQIVNLYGGFLGMVGADPYVWSVISKELPERFVSERPNTCPAICRDPDGISVFADTAAFTEYVRASGWDDQRQDLSGMRFDPISPEGGEEAEKLWFFVAYYDQVGWDYDPDRGVYLRSQEVAQSDGSVTLEPMTDRLTGEQLGFENLVFLFTWHNILKPTLIEIDLYPSENRRALIFRDGRAYEATFSSGEMDRPLRFYDPEGQPFSFKPGSTWFHIVGLGSIVEVIDSGFWKVTFYP